MGTLYEALSTYEVASQALLNFAVLEDSMAELTPAADLYLRARTTKLDVYLLRSIRDSRNKKEHVARYIALFAADTKTDWTTCVYEPLKRMVQTVLSS